jgi:hypothetical protein
MVWAVFSSLIYAYCTRGSRLRIEILSTWFGVILGLVEWFIDDLARVLHMASGKTFQTQTSSEDSAHPAFGIPSSARLLGARTMWLMYYLPTLSKTSRTASELKNLDRSLLSFTPAAIVSMMAAA